MSTLFKDYLASIGAPRFGEYWEGQGGILVNFRPGEAGERDSFLIVSVDEAVDVEWGGYGEKIEGADSRYDGRANTDALISSVHAHPAAEWAKGYAKDGLSDFYLPAQRELNLCYATIPGKFEKDWYWSSTQESAGWAWFQYFDLGTQLTSPKTSELRARAVRRLEI